MEVWTPTYETEYSTSHGSTIRQVPVQLDNKECPMSTILRNPDAAALAERVQEAEFIRTTTTAVEFGSDPNEWPAVWWDAVFWAEVEKSRLQEARDKHKPVVFNA